jgi:hypothetical protein
LQNAYQWRGRVKRKRGTQFLNRLKIPTATTSIGNSAVSPWNINTIYSTFSPAIIPPSTATVVQGSVTITIASTPIIKFTDNGNGTLGAVKIGTITGATNANPCQITSNGHTLTTGSVVTISSVVGMTQLNGNTYTITNTGVNTFTLNGIDSTAYGIYGGGGTWTSPSSTNTGTINYITGIIVLTHTAGAGVATTASFSYYPGLPVMGFRDFAINSSQYPGNLAFDTKKAYNVLVASPFTAYDVSYYKNVAADAHIGFAGGGSPARKTAGGRRATKVDPRFAAFHELFMHKSAIPRSGRRARGW